MSSPTNPDRVHSGESRPSPVRTIQTESRLANPDRVWSDWSDWAKNHHFHRNWPDLKRLGEKSLFSETHCLQAENDVFDRFEAIEHKVTNLIETTFWIELKLLREKSLFCSDCVQAENDVLDRFESIEFKVTNFTEATSWIEKNHHFHRNWPDLKQLREKSIFSESTAFRLKTRFWTDLKRLSSKSPFWSKGRLG